MNKLLDINTIFTNNEKYTKKRLSEIRRGCKKVSLDNCHTQDWLPLSLDRFPPIYGYSRFGAYMVKHITDTGFDNIRYVGNGVVGSRKKRIKDVFQNDGRAVVSKNGSSSDCRVASKLFQEDPKLGNWLFWCCRIPKLVGGELAEKFYVEGFERSLHDHFNPLYNLAGLIGK